jgi:Protein of unknown function (DUF664)
MAADLPCPHARYGQHDGGMPQMSVAELLVDGFGRIREVVHEVLDGLTLEDLTYRADEQANSIDWLIWHLTRVQDDHVATAAGLEQVWPEGWMQRAGLPFAATEIGYGQDPVLVAEVRLPPDLLVGYHDATYAQTISFVNGLRDADLSRIVDRAWDPPVTLGVRLVSVLSDDLQHAGQAAFIRGLIERR